MSATIIPFPTSNRFISIEPISAIDLAKALDKAANNASKIGVAKQKKLRQQYYDRMNINIALEALWPFTTNGRKK